MLVVMLGALIATCLANVCADPANLFCRLSAHTHHLCSRVADGGTFHVQLNAPSHHLNMLFLQARGRTMITDSSTPKACFNTVLVLMIISCHSFLDLAFRSRVSVTKSKPPSTAQMVL
jgi:hypothetical protein